MIVIHWLIDWFQKQLFFACIETFQVFLDPGQCMDCPAQTVDPRLAHTIHGLSQAQHDQLNTYLKPQRLRCRISNPKSKSLTSPCAADRSPSLRLRPVPFVCGAWLCVAQSSPLLYTSYFYYSMAWFTANCVYREMCNREMFMPRNVQRIADWFSNNHYAIALSHFSLYE